jgi:2-keto-4-pentenoate hydratase/2-oxohepta-3-ene-1,7-dioic acid hydratase in catechol pathway
MTFEHDGHWRPGIDLGEQVIDIIASWDTAFGTPPETMEEVVQDFEALRPALEGMIAAGEAVLRERATLHAGPVLPRPGKILCVGLNYRQHAEETRSEIPEYPVLFGKFGNAIAAPGQVINISGLERVDYESELGVVIGRRTRHCPAEAALGHVFGYCNANDVSERGLQRRSGQWLLGKSLDDFLPIGPQLVTRDEVPDPQALRIRGWLNGELRQDSSTADMIFSVAQIIEYASSYFTLEAGDLIITGTPSGVIMGREDKQWLADGDEYVVEVEGLGRLVNRMHKD